MTKNNFKLIMENWRGYAQKINEGDEDVENIFKNTITGYPEYGNGPTDRAKLVALLDTYERVENKANWDAFIVNLETRRDNSVDEFAQALKRRGRALSDKDDDIDIEAYRWVLQQVGMEDLIKVDPELKSLTSNPGALGAGSDYSARADGLEPADYGTDRVIGAVYKAKGLDSSGNPVAAAAGEGGEAGASAEKPAGGEAVDGELSAEYQKRLAGGPDMGAPTPPTPTPGITADADEDGEAGEADSSEAAAGDEAEPDAFGEDDEELNSELEAVQKVKDGTWKKNGKKFPRASHEVIELVRQLQKKVGATDDGVFGNETAKAVRASYYGSKKKA